MTHYTRQMIVDAIQGTELRQYLPVRLYYGDDAWQPGMVPYPGPGTTVAGPGLATYARRGTQVWLFAFDPLAGDHDPRCDVVNTTGDVCRLLAGDHAFHYWDCERCDGAGYEPKDEDDPDEREYPCQGCAL